MYGGVGIMHRVLVALVVLVAAREARADEPATTPAPPAASVETPAPAAAKPAEASAVMLHVASKETVTIQKDDTGEVVCTSPCDKPVPADARYRIGGHRPSPSFVLAPGANGKADLHVNAGSKAGFWTGVGGVTLGTLALGAGIGVLVYGVNNRNHIGGADSETTDTSFTDTMTVGTVIIVAGVTLALTGGAFMVANASTELWGNVRKSGGSTRDAQPRTLPQRPTSTVAVGALPRPTFVPIFSGTF